MGQSASPRNFPANEYSFRQDSSFLFFTGCHEPGAACMIWPDGTSTLYLPQGDPGDELWHGRQIPREFIARRAGTELFAHAEYLSDAIEDMRRKKVRVHTARVSTAADNTRLAMLMADSGGIGEEEGGSTALLDAIVEARLCRDSDELASMRKAADITAKAHRLAMASTHPGVIDYEIHALINATFQSAGMSEAYPSIVTIEGEVLHGHASGRELRKGQLLLVDAGAETPEGYASDVTRTWPVGGRFEGFQKEAYNAVLAAQKAAIKQCKPGNEFREVHLAACRVMIKFLVDQLLLVGEVDELLEMGAHAPFFPHGVGHLIGLDVHDMELLGDRAGYEKGRSRSNQFGLSFLRLDRTLRPGMVVTVEPGFYIIPSLLRDPEMRDQLSERVKWEEAHRLAPFGGIRIEDDILITEEGHENLTAAIPRESKDIEALVGSGKRPGERLSAE